MPSARYKPGSTSFAEAVPAAADPRRELLGRILASSAFAKSERLSSLLTYICHRTFAGRGKELNEQMIGEAVFDRQLDYDSSIDGIVRTQASRLRKRLDLYFSGEGADESTRIVIPRGGYIPLFEPRTSVPPPVVSPGSRVTAEAASTIEPGVAAAPRSSGAVVAWCLVAILAVGIVAILVHDRGGLANGGSNPAPAHSFAIPIFSAAQPTLIVPSDTGLVISEASMNRDVGLAEYLRGDYLETSSKTPNARETLPSQLGRRRYTSIVDLEVVRSITEIARSEKSKFEVRYARDVRPNDLKQGNVILLGAAEGNPWVELFERNMNFVISKNWKSGVFTVSNRSPQGNEAHQWNSAYEDPRHRVYGIVAYLPNLGGDRDALILEGTSMAGTECAWDFVSDDSQLLPFLNRIRRPNGTIPHFEVLLETSNMSGSAVKGSVLGWRVRP
ncbi:hypothetical protein [Terracidiphilus sp.]|jgi:hypothetical protein|uniref:hypothetical protein n=1 Tax=Terracidiphilus sp. TaxID=1964191 RepID=UPI003C1A17EA